MENNWKKSTLADLIDIMHGYAFKGEFFSDNETRNILLTPGNYRIGGGFKGDKFKYYKDNVEFPEDYILKDGDILITMTDLSKGGDTLGYPLIVPHSDNSIYLHNQRLGKIIFLNEKINHLFLYYLMCTREYREEVLAGATGTTVKHTAPKRILKFEFMLPSIKEQKKIAEILWNLDKKIEINNEMNKILEEMTQAIFKSWFVDFELFKDGEFEESELGIIPKGWNITELSELGDIITGKTPSKNNLEFFGNKYKFITPKDINKNMFITKTERGLSEDGYNKMKKNKHIKYSIGVSCIGSDLGEVYINDEDGFTNQQINTLTLNNYKYYPYVYIYLKNMKDEFKSMASGSAVPIINKTTFSNIKIILPSEKYIEDFYNKINAMFDKILININQNEELKAMRDTLLPKLISGEINI